MAEKKSDLTLKSKEKTGSHKPWVVYMLRCSDNSFYVGISNDLTARLAKHNQGKGAKYTAGRRPVQLVYWEEQANKGQALKRELALKKLRRQQKSKLAAGSGPPCLSKFREQTQS